MRIGPPTGRGQDLRITSFEGKGILIIEMTWNEWDELIKDADYLKKTGKVRDMERT